MTAAAAIESLDAARLVLAATPTGGSVVIPVSSLVPPWLAQLVSEAASVDVGVVVVVGASPWQDPDLVAGWEIGVATASLAAGASVEGIAARRMERVSAVHQRWEGR